MRAPAFLHWYKYAHQFYALAPTLSHTQALTVELIFFDNLLVFFLLVCVFFLLLLTFQFDSPDPDCV